MLVICVFSSVMFHLLNVGKIVFLSDIKLETTQPCPGCAIGTFFKKGKDSESPCACERPPAEIQVGSNVFQLYTV